MNFGESNEVIIIDSVQTEVADKRTDINGHRSLFSRRDFSPKEVISKFYWDKVYSKPSYLTVQISENEHIILMPEYLDCVNHSCEPNCFFDTTNKQLIALRPITAGDEFTFFYPSAEWDMDQAFQCRCGQDNCIGLIKGAKYLNNIQTKKYRFTDFIKKKLTSAR